MILNFKYGLEFNGIIYGWKDKELYRLPQMIGKRFYPLKKCGTCFEGNGYLLLGKRKSIKQLESMTILINKKISKVVSSDCPF